MACRRQMSSTLAPASCSFSTPITCSSLNRLCFMGLPPRRSKGEIPARNGPDPGGKVEQDEARIGRKNKPTRRWARRGTRPRAPHDQRTAWADLFGAFCPAEGKGAGLVMPFCDTEAMQAHLAEIGAMVASDAHAVLLLDQVGWHLAGALVVMSTRSTSPVSASAATCAL